MLSTPLYSLFSQSRALMSRVIFSLDKLPSSRTVEKSPSNLDEGISNRDDTHILFVRFISRLLKNGSLKECRKAASSTTSPLELSTTMPSTYWMSIMSECVRTGSRPQMPYAVVCLQRQKTVYSPPHREALSVSLRWRMGLVHIECVQLAKNPTERGVMSGTQ